MLTVDTRIFDIWKSTILILLEYELEAYCQVLCRMCHRLKTKKEWEAKSKTEADYVWSEEVFNEECVQACKRGCSGGRKLPRRCFNFVQPQEGYLSARCRMCLQRDRVEAWAKSNPLPTAKQIDDYALPNSFGSEKCVKACKKNLVPGCKPGRLLPAKFFYKSKSGALGLASQCKNCHKWLRTQHARSGKAPAPRKCKDLSEFDWKASDFNGDDVPFKKCIGDCWAKELPQRCFSKCARNKDGYQNVCKKCMGKRSSIRRNGKAGKKSVPLKTLASCVWTAEELAAMDGPGIKVCCTGCRPEKLPRAAFTVRRASKDGLNSCCKKMP